MDYIRAPAPIRMRLLSILFAGASLMLAATIVLGSLDLIGKPFPGFFAWRNGVLVSLHQTSWTGTQLPLGAGVITQINGRPLRIGDDPLSSAREAGVSEPIVYDVRTAAGSEQYSIAPMRLTRVGYALTLGSYVLNGLALLAIGSLSLWLRPDLPAARSLAYATGILGALLLLAVDYVTTYRFVALCRGVEALAPAALAQLALVFPHPIGSVRARWLAIGTLVVVPVGLTLDSGLVYQEQPEYSQAVMLAIYTMVAIALIALIARCAAESRWAESPERRVVAGVVLAGWLPAFALAASGMLSLAIFGWAFSWSWIFALLPFAAATTAYAVLRHDLLQAERFARFSAGYSLASGVMLLLFVSALTLGEQWIAGDSVMSPLAALVVLLAVGVFFEPLRRRMQGFIDRAFYQSELGDAAELEALSAKLSTLEEEGDIVWAVEDQVRKALGSESARLRIGESNDLGAPLCEALRFRGKTLGMLDCGRKKSGAPFSTEECDFVRGVADQVALALHNRRAILGRREAQEALLRSAQLSAVGAFAQTVAHGIRNPLSGVRSVAEMAKRQLESNDAPDRVQLADSMNHILSETDRVERQIRTLLEYSKSRETSMEEVDLADLLDGVANAMRSYAARSNVTVQVEGASLRQPWDLDRSFFTEALLELATNATNAMPDGGRLTLRLDAGPAGPVLEVEDTGQGVSERHRDQIFDLSFTTRTEGMGIGLVKAREIVEAHSGRLDLVRSGPDGSLFRISLEGHRGDD